ncbi:hypothetical protein HOU00_gp200 [Caulobacter phage CcrPW]|uniref:Uncharacterized protein n=1 Tax=Caulobacter phage CcrPW TaxID=2283271 RepID=A0A385ED46_9CAUD|nr:hypothetical protein HOU00_gp200 [Caulobacter phage CcrPW]AXQ68925.1 hypothetical protein CcrPW_gp386 [Caulobacter phage CcrPW]
MGTRAQFFINHPSDLEKRIWLGSVAWDGYPEGDIGEAFQGVKTVHDFREAVDKIALQRDDYCDPDKRSFPFPWMNDLYLTDCTYAFFDDAVQFTYFHNGFMPLEQFLALTEEQHEELSEREDQLPENVPAPTSALPPGPDSIIIVSAAG